MASVTIDLSDGQYEKLQTLAAQHGVSVQALLKSSVEDWLAAQAEDFEKAADYVLAKNAELYRRLA